MWRATVIPESALILFLLYHRAHQRWPSLAAFLGAQVLRDFVLLYADRCDDAVLYARAYYIGSAVAIAAEVWLIREIALALVGPLKILRAKVATHVPLMTATFIVVSTFATLSVHSLAGVPHLATLIYYGRRMDAGAATGCSGALTLLLGIAVSLKIQFSHGVRPVAIGLLIETAFSYVQAVFFMDGAIAQSIFPYVRCTAYLTTLLCFSAPALPSMRRGRRLPPSPNPALPKLQRSTGHVHA